MSASVLAHFTTTIERERELARLDRAAGYFLRYLGDPVLSTPAVRLASADDLPPELVPAMRRIMHAKRHGRDGAGLAANQVGAALAVIIARVEGVETAMLNPRIIARSETTRTEHEGCLSIPGFETLMTRAHWIDVEWEDEAFTTHFRRIGERVMAPGHELEYETQAELVAYGERYLKMPDRQFEARIVQHECDHLAGRQIVDRVTRQQRRQAERAVEKARARR